MSTFYVEFKKVFQEQQQEQEKQISRLKTASAKPRGQKWGLPHDFFQKSESIYFTKFGILSLSCDYQLALHET